MTSRDVEAAVQAYTDRVRELPQVQKVLLEKNDADYRVYAIIEAPPDDFEESRPLYQAELEVLRDRPLLPLDFIVINAATDEVRALPMQQTQESSEARDRIKILFDRQHASPSLRTT